MENNYPPYTITDKMLNYATDIMKKIGEANYFDSENAQDAIGYVFENVFGCMEYIDMQTGEKEIFTNLYVLPEGLTFSQINCQGCVELPENHGFDIKIWDLSDSARPKLKER